MFFKPLTPFFAVYEFLTSWFRHLEGKILTTFLLKITLRLPSGIGVWIKNTKMNLNGFKGLHLIERRNE